MSKSRKRRNSSAAKKDSKSGQKSSKLARKSAKKVSKKSSKPTKKSAKKKSKKSREHTDYASLFQNSVGNDIEQRIRARILKKRQEEAEEEELLRSTSSSGSSSAQSSSSNSESKSANSTSAKSSSSSDSEDVSGLGEPTPPNPESLSRRASLIASSNVNPSDGDDEGTTKDSSKKVHSVSGSAKSKSSKTSAKSKSSKKSKSSNESVKSKSSKVSGLSGSMDSNRSQLSSKPGSEIDLLNDETPENPEKGDFGEYDDIERQLIQDQEKELAYLNGLDQPINKADLPLLVPDENQNGPFMNEPMKLRISRLKRTKIWVRNLVVHEEPLEGDEVDQSIQREKMKNDLRSLSDDEYNMESIFDTPTVTPDDQSKREKTLKMESCLKNAILERLKKKR